MKKYILIDSYNLFFRALYATSGSTLDDTIGLSLHTLFSMIKKACDKINPDHLVLCVDGNGTWRKGVYPLYKMNRVEKYQEMKPSEIEKYEALKDVFENHFLPFIKDKTNISYLSCDNAEADDLIARFVATHPSDNIFILSTDNDFVQLLADNVSIFNSMEERLITNKCIINLKTNKPISFTIKDGKISVDKSGEDITIDNLVPYNDWVDYALFMKCIRGDKSDNIFSAYPGVREKSTKNKVGIREAFEDRNNKGLAWTSFMESTWDEFDKKVKVKDKYLENKKIIDLKEIPEELSANIDKTIEEQLKPKNIVGVTMNLNRFLDEWKLERLKEGIESFSVYFSQANI